MTNLIALQEKYMTYTFEGELCSFDTNYLRDEEMDLHSDFTELFETGYYYTNNEAVVDRMRNLLKREEVSYVLNEENSLWKYKLSL